MQINPDLITDMSSTKKGWGINKWQNDVPGALAINLRGIIGSDEGSMTVIIRNSFGDDRYM